MIQKYYKFFIEKDFRAYSILLFLFIFLLITYFAFRVIPFTVIPLKGEDGTFAQIAIDGHKGPDYGQIARVDGVEKFISLQHPAPLYEWMHFSMSPWVKIFGIESKSGIDGQMRFIFSFYQFFFWSILLLVLFKLGHLDFWSACFFFILTIMPAAIKNSIDLQVENSSGTILFGSIFIIVLIKETIPLFFLAGFLASMGKNEWSLACLGAIILTYALCLILKQDFKKNTTRFLAVILGLIIGNLISYAYDPLNYMGGFDVIHRRGQDSKFLENYFFLFNWIINLIKKLPSALENILLMSIAGYLLFKRYVKNKLTFSQIFVFMFSVSLMLPYMISGFGAKRYFFPSFLGFSVLSLFLLKEGEAHFKEKIVKGISFVMILILPIFQGWYYLKFNNYKDPILVSKTSSCVPFTDCLSHIKEAEYICDSVGLDWAKDYAGKFNKGICP